MTLKEFKAKQRQLQRKSLKHIEGILHPCPVIDGVEILHRHQGRKIYFSAWKNDSPMNSKAIIWERDVFLDFPEGYDWYGLEKESFQYLLQE